MELYLHCPVPPWRALEQIRLSIMKSNSLKNSVLPICLWSMGDRANDVLRVAWSCWICYIPYIISFDLCRIHTCQRTLIEYAEYRHSLTCYWHVTKVKCTPVQAPRLCTGRTTHRGSRSIALLFLDHGTRRGEGSASRPYRSLPPGKTRYPLYSRVGGPRAGLDRCGKSRPHRHSIPDPPARSSVCVPTTLPGPHVTK